MAGAKGVHLTMSGSRRSNPHYVLGLLLAGYVLNSFDRSILGILLEPIRLDLGLRDTHLGLLGGLAFAVVYSTCGLPLAMWADRWSRRNVLILSIVVWSVMTSLCGFATGLITLMLARIGTALGEAGASPASQSMISEYFSPARRATALGIFALGAPAGSMLAGALGGFGNETFGWRETFIWAGVPGLILAPLLFLTVREPRAVAAPDTRVRSSESSVGLRLALSTLWGQRSFRYLCVACAFHAFGMYAAATFNAAFLMRSYGWGTSEAGSLLALAGGFGLLGTYAGGWIADRLRRRSSDERWLLLIPATAAALLVPARLFAYLGDEAAVSATALLTTGFLSTVFFGPSFAASQALAGSNMRAVAAATLILVKTLFGLGLGPLAVGALSDYLAPSTQSQSLRYAMLLLVIVEVVAAIHFMIAARHLAGDLKRAPSVRAPGGVATEPQLSP